MPRQRARSKNKYKFFFYENNLFYGAGISRPCFSILRGKEMFRLILASGDIFYYDTLEEARFDKMQFGGKIYDRNGKEIY